MVSIRSAVPLLVLSLLIGVSGLVFGQSSSNRTAVGGGTISGKVTDHGKGVLGITVTARAGGFGGGGGGSLQARTDSEGVYRITNVPVGSYLVIPSAPAYVAQTGTRLFSPTDAVVITGNESIDGIDFQLVRGGVVTGKVADADGNPIVEVTVSLQNADQNAQRGPGFGGGGFGMSARTDDRGIYRIYGVAAGKYTVSVGTQRRLSAFATVSGQKTYEQTFHPDVKDVAQATVIEVAEGMEVPNVNITTGATIDAYSVTGRVVDDKTNLPVPNVGFALSVIAGGGNRQRGIGAVTVPAVSDANGNFQVDNLSPGKYSLSLDPQSANGMTGTSAAFDVINQSVSGIEVRAKMGASIFGYVSLEGNQDPSIISQLMQFQVQASVQTDGRGPGMNSQTIPLNADGSFQLTGLASGTIRLNLLPTDPTLDNAYRIVRIEKDGTIQNRGIAVNNGDQITGVRLVTVYADGVVKGSVKFQNGGPTAGMQVFARLNGAAQGVRGGGVAMVDQRGNFLLQNVPAGSYTLIVTANNFGSRRGGGRPNPQQAPITVQQQVVVNEGQTSTVTLTMDLTPPAPPNPAP